MTETEIIDLIYNSHPGGGGGLDDCSEIPGGGLVTTDSMAQNVHFRLDWSGPADIAIRLFTANISDLTASGGRFQWALLNLGIPDKTPRDFIETFLKTLHEEIQNAGGELIGGDTHRADTMVFTLTLGGTAERFLDRKSGKPGDTLYLSGPIGLSLAGYEHLQSGRLAKAPRQTVERAVEHHLRPRIDFEVRSRLMEHPDVHAAMDLSDGIFEDALKLSRASQVNLLIDIDRIPLAPEIQGFLSQRESIYSGEEFELLFLGEPGLEAVLSVYSIGTASAAGDATISDGCCVYREANERVDPVPPSFRHFSS